MKRWLWLVVVGLLLAGNGWAASAVQVEVGAAVNLGKSAVDLQVSADGARVYVLHKGGEVQVLTPAGELLQRFSLGFEAERLAVSPDGGQLFVTAGNNLRVVEVATLHPLPVLNSPVKGNAAAPVTLTIFSDFQCPYCSRLVPILDEIQARNPDTVRLVFKQFPLRMHNMALPAALASLAAREQGKFWPMHDLLFMNFNQLSDDKIRALAKEAGLDLARFDQDRAAQRLRDEVLRDQALGQQAGVQGTPTVFLNGRLLRERNPAEVQALIDREVAKSRRAGNP